MSLFKKPISPLAWVLGLSAAFFAIFLVISGVIFVNQSPSAGKSGLFGNGSVGIVEVNGVIMDSKKTIKRLERFSEDANIKAVVLRLNSPGGAVAPSQEIYQAVKAYKKPLVVSMSSIAASGAYYVACGAKKVFANPGTITGSIGVIMEFANLEKLYEWAKIKRYVIKTGKFKDAGSEFREMTPEEHSLLQGMVDDVLGQFKQAVSTGRHLTLAQVGEVADGRIFSGAQAKSVRLVDELGTLDDAINEAAKEAGVKGKPKVVYPEKPSRRWLDLLLDDSAHEDSSYEGEGARADASGLLGRVARRLLGAGSSALIGDVPASVPGVYWLWSGAR